jgi:hypothetical protein
MAILNPLHVDYSEDVPIKKQEETPNDHPDAVAIEATPTGDQQNMRAVANWKIVNQDYGPYGVGKLFAGSVLFLKPATQYEVRFTMSDPDGGAPAESKIVSVATCREPAALAGGRTIHVDPEKGLMAAYQTAQPGDILLLHPRRYQGPFELRKPGAAPTARLLAKPNGGDYSRECNRRVPCNRERGELPMMSRQTMIVMFTICFLCSPEIRAVCVLCRSG